MECQCDKDEDVAGFWMNGNKVQMGAVTVVGYLLYRFSQTLPALIRWPIHLFCSLSGVSSLWGWVSHLVGTVRGIQSLCKWLARVWQFIVGVSSKFKWLGAVVRAIKGSSDGALDPTSSNPNKPGLRLILLGPKGGGRTSIAEVLLGSSDKTTPRDPLMESTKRIMIMDGREVTVIDTPDLLGTSLGNSKRAREALRSLQLTGPGPHAFLLVIRAPGSGMEIDHDVAQDIRATLDLFGDGAMEYIIPVLTHADRLGRRPTVHKLLDADTSLKRALAVCDQKPELVANRADFPPGAQRKIRRQLLKRVMEMDTLRGHFVHELQRKEDRIREELLADMASALAMKVGQM